MKRIIDRIFIITLLFLIALSSSCATPDPLETESGQVELITSDDKIPRWLLLDHYRNENSDFEADYDTILVETNNDVDETEGFREAITNLEPTPEDTSPADKPTPEKKQDPITENENLNSDELSPSEIREINKAKEALREIEKEYRTASSEEKMDLEKRYNHIINKLKTEYGIIHENNLEKAEWWKLDRDSSSSFRHEVQHTTD